MKKFYLLIIAALNVSLLKSQSVYFPPLSGSAWDTISPQSMGWCQPRIDSLYNYLQVKNTKSFMILKNGKIILEKYFGTYTADSAFYWASASKSLASFITGIALQKGYINLSNQVSQYIASGWTSETLNKENLITLKHLITMTSGLDDSPPVPCGNDDTAKACLVYKADAGTRWGYQTGAYKKIQDVVSAAVGLNYNVITNNWIKVKTGMSGLWIDQTYYSKAREMARYGILMLNKGIWNGDTLLADTNYYNAMINTSQAFNPSYGYLWWLNGKSGYLNPGLQLMINGPLIPNAPNDMYCALGKNDQKIYVTPSTGFVVVRQGNSAEGVTFALSNFDNNLWDYINKLSCTNTGLNEFNHSTTMSVYPNPASVIINIKTAVPLKAVMMQDVYGHDFNMTISSNSINVSLLAKGLYIIKAQLMTNEWAFKKILVN